MNRQKIDEMIIKAMEIIASNEVEILEQNKVPSQYIGYIASFGPSVVQTGLIQTVAFYSKNDEQNPRKNNEEKSTQKNSRSHGKNPGCNPSYSIIRK
ncbi:MAG: CRISPR-associated Cmr5 family protein [Candidatus Magnetoglobus multicellularis str. Araruama]|uniref:CRISPR type III-B/RAMP module-associated protein Cmr5 n=1 Tax=Candidatus Magnetoglobus multicellularis str. Araruama TaxID=890399 RepID=A0A1V1P7C5_9BACT|nr:MAG: CRISPR-associated Cmr5 family protein [Candidatus Magnetoglobus multicellularis str. Araruama]